MRLTRALAFANVVHMETNPFLQVEALLASHRVSVARLCRRADVSESTWHRLREGKTAAGRAGTVARLAAALTELTGEAWPSAVEAAEAA
jgi:DNA-binding Xre family transcriptional regulator